MKAKANEASTTNGISLLNVPSPTLIGSTIAVTPTIINTLNTLLPTTLPMAMSALPPNDAIVLMTNSGAEVPNATMVRPITRSEILKRFATAAAPSVSALAPSKINAKPPTRKSVSSIFYNDFLFFSVRGGKGIKINRVLKDILSFQNIIFA